MKWILPSTNSSFYHHFVIIIIIIIIIINIDFSVSLLFLSLLSFWALEFHIFFLFTGKKDLTTEKQKKSQVFKRFKRAETVQSESVIYLFIYFTLFCLVNFPIIEGVQHMEFTLLGSYAIL